MLIPLHPLAEPAAALLPVSLAAMDATYLVRILAQPPASLLLDCSALPCQRTLGICFLVSLLLVLRQSGASIYLRNASPVLQNCLRELRLSTLFNLVD